MKTITIEDKIQQFFRDSRETPTGRTRHTTLYLLRRDIYTCFGYDPKDHSKIPYQALFPGTMAIMAGIDLLAKFRFGDAGKVGDRFQKFISTYIDRQHKQELWLLRNALMHSFGLYASGSGNHFYFTLDRGLSQMVLKEDDGRYTVDIEILRSKFEEAVLQYERELRSSKELQNIFEAMLSKYGNIEIKPSI